MRQTTTAALVFGAVIFGMVLSGGLDLTPPAQSQQAARNPAARVAAPGVGLPSFADLVEQVSAAVVSIDAATFESAEQRRRSQPFEFFMGPQDRPQQDGQEFRRDSGGSGFLVSADGYVVTNNHVIRDAEQLKVRIDGREHSAVVRGTDPATDLALLKIEGEGFPFLVLGDSQALRPGDWVMAIGSPAGLDNTVTVGVVSAKQRRIGISSETSSFENFIQTDAAINFGNSGGPLMNLAGEVIGINTAINWGSENIGFAVPVNTLKSVLPQLRDEGRVRRGFLGINVGDVSPEAAEAFGLDSTDGVLIALVTPGTPAEKAGLQVGDIVLRVDSLTVTNTRSLIDYVSDRGPDVAVELEILRDGDVVRRSVELAERPAGEQAEPASEEEEGGGIEWLGIRYQDIVPGLRAMHRIPEEVAGVWITDVSPRSPLYEAGVRADVISIIAEINGQGIASVDDLERVVGAAPAGSRLRMYVRRFANGQEVNPLFAFPAKP